MIPSPQLPIINFSFFPSFFPSSTIQLMTKTLNKVSFYLTALLLAGLPFHAILTTIFKYGLNLQNIPKLGFFITTWKEILIIIIAILFSINFLKNRIIRLRFTTDKQTKQITNIIIIYIIFGLSSYFWASPPSGFPQWLFGFRYDFFFLITFLIFTFNNFNKQNIQILFNIAIYSATASIIFGLIIFLINPENLTFFGFRNDWSTWYANQALAFCQKIENSDFCRLSGTFAGPNQYGAYLIIILPLLFYKFFQEKSKIWIFIIISALLSLFLTFSRSAWIGFIIEILLLSIIFLKQKYSNFNLKKSAIFSLLSAILIAIIFIGILKTNSELFQRITKPESTSEHFSALFLGLETIKNHPFGLGLGTAGPASYRFENDNSPAIITENWYLQISVEMGIMAMILFIVVLVTIIYSNLKTTLSKFILRSLNVVELSKLYLTIALCGLSISALFLHSFEDSSTVLTLFTLLSLTNKLY